MFLEFPRGYEVFASSIPLNSLNVWDSVLMFGPCMNHTKPKWLLVKSTSLEHLFILGFEVVFVVSL